MKLDPINVAMLSFVVMIGLFALVAFAKPMWIFQNFKSVAEWINVNPDKVPTITQRTLQVFASLFIIFAILIIKLMLKGDLQF